MQWEEKVFWISRGFRTTITIEIACPAHGLYRAELAEEQEQYLCPACSGLCRATIICEGVTRRIHEPELGVDLSALGVAFEALVAGESRSIGQAAEEET
jgi:hypothetical protein